MSLALIGLPNSWHSYWNSVNERDNLLDYEHLWSDLVIEEIRKSTRDGNSDKGKEEDFALVGKGKKSKGKKSKREGGKGYLSKVNFFHYHEHGSYASKCP